MLAEYPPSGALVFFGCAVQRGGGTPFPDKECHYAYRKVFFRAGDTGRVTKVSISELGFVHWLVVSWRELEV